MTIDTKYALAIGLEADRRMIAALSTTNMKRTALHYCRKAQDARRALAGEAA